MAATREGKVSALAIKGLVNGVNKVQMPPGCCRIARNVTFRETGVVHADSEFVEATTSTQVGATITGIVQDLTIPNETRIALGKATGAFCDTTSGLTHTTRKVWTQDDDEELGRVGSYVVKNYDLSTTTTVTQLPTNTAASAFRNIGAFPGNVRAIFVDGRQILTEKWSPIVDYARQAGVPRPKRVTMTPTASGQGGFLPYDYCVKYRATLAIVYRQGPDSPVTYDVESAPTGAFFYRNVTETGGLNLNITVSVDYVNEGVLLGRAGEQMFVRVYRSMMGDSTATSSNLGDEYRLVAEAPIVVTGTNWTTSGFVTVLDNVLEPQREARPLLYTEEEGGIYENLVPPAATDIAWFKDSTLYANYAGWPTKSVACNGLFGFTDATTPDRRLAVGQHTFFSDGATYGFHTAFGGSNVTLVTDSTTNDMPVYPGQQLQVTGVTFTDPTVLTVSYTAPGTWVIGMASTASVSVTAAAGSLTDRMRVTVTYVDDTVQTNTFGIVSLGSTIEEGSANQIPGLRIVPGVLAFTEATQSTTIIVTIAATYAKRIKYFIVEADGGTRYWPNLPAIGASTDGTRVVSVQENRRNRVMVAKPQLPESVPAASFFNVGHGSIIRLISTDLCVYAFCTDGLYRIDGQYQDWTVSRIDPTIILSGAECVTAVGAVVYAWTTKGLFAVYGDATTRLDENIFETFTDTNRNISNVLNFTPFHSAARLFYDVRRDEVLFDWRYDNTTVNGSAEILRYNVKTKIFSTLTLNDDANSVFDYNTTITPGSYATDAAFFSGGFASGYGGKLYAITKSADSDVVRWLRYAEDTETPLYPAALRKRAVLRFWPQYADDTTDKQMFQELLVHVRSEEGALLLTAAFLGDDVSAASNVSKLLPGGPDIKIERLFPPHNKQTNYAAGLVLLLGAGLHRGFELCGFEWYYRSSNSVPTR